MVYSIKCFYIRSSSRSIYNTTVIQLGSDKRATNGRVILCAPHLEFPTNFVTLRAFVHFSFNILICGTKESLLLNITPKYLTYFTTLIWFPSNCKQETLRGLRLVEWTQAVLVFKILKPFSLAQFWIFAAQLRQPIENSLVLCHLKTLRLYTGLFKYALDHYLTNVARVKSKYWGWPILFINWSHDVSVTWYS